jgi:hypothetical protein
MGTPTGGSTADGGGFNLEYAALQRLAGAGQAGNGLPAVLNALQQKVQNPGSKPLDVSSFPDAEDFNLHYNEACDQILGTTPGSSFGTLVDHVSALSSVAGWTVTNYTSAASLEAAGTGVVQAQLNQALSNPNGSNVNTSAGIGVDPQTGLPNSTGRAQ